MVGPRQAARVIVCGGRAEAHLTLHAVYILVAFLCPRAHHPERLLRGPGGSGLPSWPSSSPGDGQGAGVVTESVGSPPSSSLCSTKSSKVGTLAGLGARAGQARTEGRAGGQPDQGQESPSWHHGPEQLLAWDLFSHL